MPARRRFSTLGGDPALDLLNTQPRGDEGLDERLTDLDALIAWCELAGLVRPAEARRLRAAGGSGATVGSVREMREALRAKFEQHPKLKALLLSTGDAELIEHTHNDRYWADGGDGTGRNMLGKLLMELRTGLSKV